MILRTTYLVLFVLCATLTPLLAQNEGRLSGDLQLNARFFEPDSARNAANTPFYDYLFYGAESWLSLNYTKNDFIVETNEITSQESIVESVSEGFVSSFDIINSGSDYKVNDILNFNDSGTSGGGLIARVSSIEGKDITKIDTSIETYENSIFTYNAGGEVKVTIKPYHNLSNNDFVMVSGFSTNLSKLNNSYKIGVSSYYSNVLKDIPSTSTSGLTTEIYITQLPETVSIGSSIAIGSERLSVLEVYKNLNILKVERGSTGVSHTATTQINFIPDSFTISQNIDYFESKVNDRVFFNPKESVGVGTTAGITNTIISQFTWNL